MTRTEDPELREWVAREHDHDVMPVHHVAYVTKRGKGEERPAGVKYICARCGAVAGTPRFDRGCVKFSLPGKRHQTKPQSFRVPREGSTDVFSRELFEYYEQVDRFGGLSSIFGLQLENASNGGGESSCTEFRIPDYMGDSHEVIERRELLRAVYHGLICLYWRYQVALSKYYSGDRPLDEMVREAHELFERFFVHPPRPKSKPRTGRRWTTKELAEKAGVSRQRMQQMLKEANVGAPESDGVGRPPTVVTEVEVLRFIE